jgi:hypothetical protein
MNGKKKENKHTASTQPKKKTVQSSVKIVKFK